MKQSLQSVNHEQFHIQMTQDNKQNKWLEILDFQPTLQKAMGTQAIPDLLALKAYTQSPYSFWSEEFQVSISSDPPFLKSCVTLLYSSVFAGQSPTDF